VIRTLPQHGQVHQRVLFIALRRLEAFDSMEDLLLIVALVVVLLLTFPLLARLQGRTSRSRRTEAESGPPPDRIEQLLHDLARSDRRQAERVAARLATMGPGILERLYAALGHADFWEGVPAGERPRQMLEDLIAAFGAAAVPTAMELLSNSPSERMRRSAERILVHIGPPALGPLLETPDPSRLKLALGVLEAGGPAAREALLQELGASEKRDTDIAALVLRLGPDALPALRRYVRHRPPLPRAADLSRIVEHLERELPREEPDAAEPSRA